MSSGSAAAFTRAMVPVAIEILGEPNKARSSKTELRWGTHGSFSVDRVKGTWCDHEDGGCGGGVLDLLRIKKGLKKPDAIRWLRERKHLSSAETNGSRRIVETYDYMDAAGALLFQVVRYEPKDFRQRAPDGRGGWVWKMDGIKRVLYRLPEVTTAIAAGRSIYVCEGEKGVGAIEALGFAGTCSPGGAGKWRKDYATWLRDADVVLLPDNDEPGHRHVDQVAGFLCGIAKRVRVLVLPDLPEKGDVVDWIAAGGTAAELEVLTASATSLPPSDEVPGKEPLEAQNDNNDLVQKTHDEINDGVRRAVAELNLRYLLVNEGGKAVIYQPGYDPLLKRRHFDRLTTRDLQTFYLNERIRVGIDVKGHPSYKSKADLWLRHPDRRQFIHGVVFDPSGAKPASGVLNLWQGFSIQPAPGDWSIMRDHIKTNLCLGNEEHDAYLMKWMARMVQRPAEQGEVAVVLKGIEGSGKGTLGKVLLYILGQHGMGISNAKHLVGNFNGHLRDCVFLFADEAFYAGDRQHVGVLKSLITEPILTIEAKHQNAVQTANMLHMLMASNEKWVVPASLEARRFFVLAVSDLVAGNHSYFAELWKQMEAGGYAAMLHDLLALDLTNFNVRDVPATAALQQQRKLSLEIPQAWWMDCLHRGFVFRSKLGLEDYFSEWYQEVSTELLFASYIEFAERHRERHPMSRETMGKFLVEMGCKPKRPYNIAVGEHLSEEISKFDNRQRVAKVIEKPRAWGYSVGLLDSARGAFAAKTGLTIEWEPSEEPTAQTKWSG